MTKWWIRFITERNTILFRWKQNWDIPKLTISNNGKLKYKSSSCYQLSFCIHLDIGIGRSLVCWHTIDCNFHSWPNIRSSLKNLKDQYVQFWIFSEKISHDFCHFIFSLRFGLILNIFVSHYVLNLYFYVCLHIPFDGHSIRPKCKEKIKWHKSWLIFSEIIRECHMVTWKSFEYSNKSITRD